MDEWLPIARHYAAASILTTLGAALIACGVGAVVAAWLLSDSRSYK